jgi:hypothetical protein
LVQHLMLQLLQLQEELFLMTPQVTILMYRIS